MKPETAFEHERKKPYICSKLKIEKAMKKLIIFDLDGTLLNTIADLAQSTNHALQALGYPTHPESAYNFMVGNGINKLFERALPEGERAKKTSCASARSLCLIMTCTMLIKAALTPASPNCWNSCRRKG